ncbi:hypothetical protein AAE250_13655 [Bacteroides sp. GD17]|jgi:hypothetical protein|uniref:hypothetical protein n=1 Tax=Bacteroides sp. GD17 TaxID=3139826 RepID=UPI0025FFC5D6|nr:hypothetical protein [uncultured Bacteroides sp.]
MKSKLNKKTGWQEKRRKEKSSEDYADIGVGNVWSTDITLAKIIADHLRAFLKATQGPGACPGVLAYQYGIEKGYNEWLNIIRKMIYAFEEYQQIEFAFPECDDSNNEEDKASIIADFEASRNYKKERIREGMQLFIDYYPYLWV